MSFFFKNVKIFPALTYGIINSNTNNAHISLNNEIYENTKITRDDFLKYREKHEIYEYLKIRNMAYEEFKTNLNINNYEKSKKIFENTILYGLQHKSNICHCNEWKIYKDISEIALNNDYDKFVWFYENLFKNYENHLKKESNDVEKLIFWDSAWLSNNEINQNTFKKVSSVLFRDLVYNYSSTKKKNENSYKILKYLLENGNLDIEQISYAQNTVCCIGDLEMFKFLDENVKINYNVEYGNFFSEACSNGHLEIAKILYEKEVHKINKFGFDNTFLIVCKCCNNIECIKWLCSIYDGKHIKGLKEVFNSIIYNEETKKYLESIGYAF